MNIIDAMTATEIAEQYLKKLDGGEYAAVGGLTLMRDATVEKEYGWIFFYNSRWFIETSDIMYSLG